MSEILLITILRLFSLTASARGRSDREKARDSVRQYLSSQVDQDRVEGYLKLYDEFVDMGTEMDAEERGRAVWETCDDLRGKLPREEQFMALINLLMLARDDSGSGLSSMGAVMASALDVNWQDLESLGRLIAHPDEIGKLSENFLVIDNTNTSNNLNCQILHRDDFHARFTIMRIQETGTLILVPTGGGLLTLDGQIAQQGRFYFLPVGAVLRDEMGTPCYYSEITAALQGQSEGQRIVFEGSHVDFRFPGSDVGLHDFTFRETSGRLIGVMGGSGTGKSTLFSILNGTREPNTGQITINGHDLYREQKALEGVIGFVPQDDLLFDDLTVYQNLYYSARLCLDNLDQARTDEAVKKTLRELGQLETADLKVGTPLDKTISGGQRKRLNIALELIREPAVLFADEPTSGLSSADSLNVMSLLKEQANKGCLVIVVIHQPSSQIFKMFDSLWVLDKGGRPVFEGNPLDAVEYFREAVHQSGLGGSICPSCGNVNPEQIFEIIEMKKVDERGHFTDQRLISPEEWHKRHLKAVEARPEPAPDAEPVGDPPRRLWRPNIIGQFGIFFRRNLLARLANRQYVLINLLEAPLIALVLAWLCRYAPDGNYVFMENRNVSIFFFMSVIVILFLGLSVSAEEIVKDRKILKREGFLNLSWFGYINAKVAYLAGIVAIQSIGFILVAHGMLEIPDMHLKSFVVLFSAGVCACLIGLNVSASFKSVVAIYILVPLLLIPQMLLCGSVISFDELTRHDSSNNRVPWYANAMPSRWAYEALITEQYSSNRYMSEVFDEDCTIRQCDFINKYLLQEVKSLIDYPFLPNKPENFKETANRNLGIALTEIQALEIDTGLPSGLDPAHFTLESFTRDDQKAVRVYVKTVGDHYRKVQTQAHVKMTETLDLLEADLGSEGLDQLKKDHTNKGVRQTALNTRSLKSHKLAGGRIVQLDVPICKPTDSRMGMAHFAAGYKYLGESRISTYWFNIGFLWLISLVLYMALYFNLLELMFKLLGRLSGRK